MEKIWWIWRILEVDEFNVITYFTVTTLHLEESFVNLHVILKQNTAPHLKM